MAVSSQPPYDPSTSARQLAFLSDVASAALLEQQPSPTPTPAGLCRHPDGWGPFSGNDYAVCAEEGVLAAVQALFVVLLLGSAAARWAAGRRRPSLVAADRQGGKNAVVLKGKVVRAADLFAPREHES